MKNITLDRLAIKHDYYCCEQNYYSREAYTSYKTFTDFINEMGESDIDMNLVFRWDIKKYDEGHYCMLICIMHQRKGRYWPQEIEKVTEEDVPGIIKYLTPHLDKLKQIWKPFTL